MKETFSHPSRTLPDVDHFFDREVGLTHPDFPSFVRLRSNGDIELVATEGLSITMNAKTKSITFVADHIKFMTRHEDGLRWNDVTFNDRAVSFNEPTFIRFDRESAINRVFNHVDYYTEIEDKDRSESEKFTDGIDQRFGDEDGE